ncbi:hypothetical protein [Chryseobacterium taichungense]|uniref:hypothetical protein n=1 Tax=Chryseobacterium taichungense TaxID=295069 RepID=UPI0028A761EC|nr:hypothetical protein [Chryseobacterium taichungense]
MKRNYVLRLSFITILALSLNSCRTDDLQSETAQQPTINTKIKAFRDFEKKALAAKGAAPESYAYPFSETFDEILTEHPDYAAKFSDTFGEVDFKVASQTFGESEKLVYFPILKEGKLAYILSCAINAKRTEAFYKILDPELKEYQVIYSTFAAHYKNRPATTAKIMEGYIEEVIIEWSDPIPWWWYMIYGGATSPVHFPTPNTGTVNIPDPQVHPIGGYNGTSDPCSKVKSIVNNPKLKPKIDELKNFSLTAVEDEMGYHQDKSGNVTPADVNGNHHVDFTINQNSLGGIHNHTLNGAQMFSPRDILTLLDFAGVQNQTLPIGSTADNTGNAFLGMISQSGSYFITFNGGSGDLPPPMTDAEEDAYRIKLNKEYNKIILKLLKAEGKNRGDDLSEVGLQKLFFSIIKEMDLEGKINLIKQNGSNTSTIEQNPDGTIKAPIPC